MFKVGLIEGLVNTRYSPTALVRASYLTAVATRMDSFWLPDHLNAILPRSIATPKYLGGARLAPKVDACLEPWTVLGHLAARNRLGWLRLGIGVTDAGRRNPAVTAQAAATLHLLTKGRAILGIGTGEREGNEPYGVDWLEARWHGLKKPSPPSVRCGTPAVNSSPATPPIFRCATPCSTCRRTAESGRKSGSPPTGRGCCAPPGATPTPGSRLQPVRPKDYAASLEVVRAAASDAGRDPTSIIAATLLWVVTGRSRDEVDETLGSVAMKAFALNAAGRGVGTPRGAPSHWVTTSPAYKTSFRKPSTNRLCCPTRLTCRRRF